MQWVVFDVDRKGPSIHNVVFHKAGHHAPMWELVNLEKGMDHKEHTHIRGDKYHHKLPVKRRAGQKYDQGHRQYKRTTCMRTRLRKKK